MNAQPSTPIAVAIVRLDNRVLIGPRPEGVPLQGYWEFPGGKIREKEQAAQAAIRECLEETGLRVHVSKTSAIVEYHYDHGALRLHFLDATPIDPEASPRPPFRWIPIADLDMYRFPPANAAVLKRLKAEVS